MNWKLLLIIGLVSYGAFQHFTNKPIKRGAGVIAAESPIQNNTDIANIVLNGYQLKPLQSFQIAARVLATEHYSLDREADLAPVDLALGWGPMSDETVLKDIKISQSNRFYYLHVDNFSIPRAQIVQNSANMHMIPADEKIKKTLKNIKPGQIIHLSGYLVEAIARDGWRWKSSLTRNDTGAGACEVIYVKSILVS